MKSKNLVLFALVLSVLFLPAILGTIPLRAAANAPENASSISQIHMLDASSGWAWSTGLAGRQLLLRTSDGGETWKDVMPRGFSCEDGFFLDGDTAWVTSFDPVTSARGLLRTTDGGESWTVMVNLGAAPSLGKFECHFDNMADGWVTTADYGAGSFYCRFFDTHDGGVTWNPVPIVPPGTVSEANTPRGEIHLCSICGDGINYYPPSTVIISYGDLGDEQPKSAVRLALTTNLGKTWRDLRLPLPEKYRDGLAQPYSPVFFNEKSALLPVRVTKQNTNDTYDCSVLVFYATDDGSSAWAAKPGMIEFKDPLFCGDVDVVSANDVFVRSGQNLCVSHDGVESWQTVQPNIDIGREGSKRSLSQMDFVDAAHGWMVIHDDGTNEPNGANYLYQTTDGGATWRELP
jgi:photosystem II stability/assembly factor-like uncharacterized protein